MATIGVGTFATVTKGDSCAHKTFKSRIQLETEVLLLKRLQGHPNIVRLLSGSVDPESHTINLELADGDLARYMGLKIDPEGAPEPSEIALQLFSGLAHCHHELIIHTDIKPRNILYNLDQKRFFLADFGSSEEVGGPCFEPASITTLTYRAPELLAVQNRWDEKIDVWSLGLVYYRLVHGADAFAPIHRRELCYLMAIMDKFGFLEYLDPKLPFPQEYWSDVVYVSEEKTPCEALGVPPDRILNAALSPYPADRKSAADIVAELAARSARRPADRRADSEDDA